MELIGKKIKEVRLVKGMTLKNVSEKTGLSIGLLSQIERDKSTVTIQALSKIAVALEVSRSYFFEDDNGKERNIINNDTSLDDHFNFHSSNFVYQSLSGVINDPMFDPMLVVLLPSEGTTTSTHKGQEFVYILEGELTVIIGEEKTILKPGGSFHINSQTPHTWFNQSQNVVKLIYVYSQEC